VPTIAVRNLAAGEGLIKDRSPNSLDPRALSEAINARYVRQRLERFGGSQVFTSSSEAVELTNSRALFEINLNGAEGLIVMTAAGVFTTINGTAWVDRTPSSGWADSDSWNISQYGDAVLISSLDTEPFVLLPGGSQFVPFTNWPANYSAQKLFVYKNIVVAIGVEISNSPQSGLVKWSNVVTPDELADVAWDPADPTNIAGENILPDTDGEIRDGGVLRDSAILYTDTSVWRMDLSSVQIGAAAGVFNFRKVFSDDGIIRNRGYVEVAGAHYVVGVFDIYRTDGFNKATISDNRITEWFYQRLGTSDVVFMTHYQRPQEILISFAVDGQAAAQEAIVYNYFYDKWSRWQFATSGLYTHVTQGPEFGQAVKTWDDLATEGLTWADLNSQSWNALFPQNRNRVPYMLTTDDRILQLDVVGAGSSVTQSEMLLERRDLDLDEAVGSARPIKHIERFMPQAVGEGTLRIQFGGRNALGEAIVWQPERLYNLATDYKFDLRISYRYPAYRIRQDADEGTVALDGFDLDVSVESMR